MLKANTGAWMAPLAMLFSVNVWGEIARVNMLVKSNIVFEQTIPLVMISPGDPKAICVNLRLGWEPGVSSVMRSETMVFDFDPAVDVRSRELMHAQLWISAMAAAMAWQQPWGAAHWRVSDIPAIQEPGTEAALGVGLIATAAYVDFPKDATIIGSLFPDGSLGPAPQITKRIEAASAAGFKRLVISNLQRFEVSSTGSFLNIRDFAKSHHIECFFVDHLIEATETVLQRGLPVPPDIHASPHYDGALFNLLDQRCKKEMAVIQPAAKAWPSNPDQLAALDPAQQELWREVFQNYEAGLDAYRAGLLYVTREKMNEANGKLKAIAASNARKGNFDAKVENAKATDLRQRMAIHMNHPPMDKDEIQSALALAEEDDWLYEMNARLEGAQILARQAFAPHSHATQKQKEMSQVLLQNAVAEAEYRLQELDYYPSIEQAIRGRQPVAVPSSASFWLPQLRSAFLAAAEFLRQGLKLHANEYREALLFDPRLTTHARVLRDAHAEWEENLQRKARRQEKDQPVVVNVGFMPGSAYAPPVPPVPPPLSQSLSDTARSLTWINKYCDVSALEQKYLGPGGVFGPASLEWKNQNRATLQRMLQEADVGARRGIAFAQRAKVDPSILILIYERASHLRSSGEDKNRLEALQQFWRCSLLGNMCWQLSPAAKVEDTVALSLPVSPSTSTTAPFLSTNSPPAVAPTIIPPSLTSIPAERPPASVRAHALTPEESLQLEKSDP